jgi:hypothetical protein
MALLYNCGYIFVNMPKSWSKDSFSGLKRLPIFAPEGGGGDVDARARRGLEQALPVRE